MIDTVGSDGCDHALSAIVKMDNVRPSGEVHRGDTSCRNLGKMPFVVTVRFHSGAPPLTIRMDAIPGTRVVCADHEKQGGR